MKSEFREILFPDRKLNRNRRPHVTPLCGRDIYLARDTLRSGLGNDVKQYLANLACAGSDRVSLFVLKRINLPIGIQGKDHWFSVHSLRNPLSPFDQFYSLRAVNRFLTAPAIPSKPDPRSSILAGSGTALPVICPWTVVIPLFDAGGTRFNGLLVIE